MTQAHDRYRQYLESLTPEALGRLGDYVSSDVRFKDPFNDVHGVDAMARVFRHMFETVKDIRFHVTHAASTGNICLMAWRFEGRIGGRPWAFDGTSVVTFAADGRVSEHIDYWDAARDFYERLPVIGWLLARIRRRLAAR
ncbi:MAG: nuclear transport factor 2 family protein [Rhodospirillales bacterium]